MKEKKRSVYIKRTQKDYNLSLKLQVVKEIEQGQISCKSAQRKYGIPVPKSVSKIKKGFQQINKKLLSLTDKNKILI